jgi:hypothetical protein
MTQRSRYFLVGSAVLLLVGLGGGLIAYFTYHRASDLAAGLPAELRYVPANADLVAYADVKSIMQSELRKELEEIGSQRGRQRMQEIAGIDLEKQVNYVVAFLEPMESAVQQLPAEPRGMMMAQGTFDQPAIEQFIREHGGTIEDYQGKRLAVHRSKPGTDAPDRAVEDMAIGFVGPGLIALGQADLVRRAMDSSNDPASGSGRSVTTSADLMALIEDASGSTAWVVGRFDAVRRRIGIPPALSQQVPPLRLVSAKADINGGMKAAIREETADQASADQLRDVVRGFISLVRLQTGARPELQNALKSIELAGTGTTVRLSFAMTPGALRAIAPVPRQP